MELENDHPERAAFRKGFSLFAVALRSNVAISASALSRNAGRPK
jgi:hypothetical protein